MKQTLQLILSAIVQAAIGLGVWGWLLFNGLLSTLLGGLIWSQFPLSGPLAIGILLGIKLLASGMLLIMLGFAARSAAAST